LTFPRWRSDSSPCHSDAGAPRPSPAPGTPPRHRFACPSSPSCLLSASEPLADGGAGKGQSRGLAGSGSEGRPTGRPRQQLDAAQTTGGLTSGEPHPNRSATRPWRVVHGLSTGGMRGRTWFCTGRSRVCRVPFGLVSFSRPSRSGQPCRFEDDDRHRRWTLKDQPSVSHSGSNQAGRLRSVLFAPRIWDLEELRRGRRGRERY
jgi:hypothetical protein